MQRVGVLWVQISDRKVDRYAEIDLTSTVNIVKKVHTLGDSGPCEVNRHLVSFLAWIVRRRIKLKIGANDLPVALDNLIKRKGNRTQMPRTEPLKDAFLLASKDLKAAFESWAFCVQLGQKNRGLIEGQSLGERILIL